MKINIYAINDNIKNVLWTYRFNSPCKNFALKVIMQNVFNSTNCYVKKVSNKQDSKIILQKIGCFSVRPLIL